MSTFISLLFHNRLPSYPLLKGTYALVFFFLCFESFGCDDQTPSRDLPQMRMDQNTDVPLDPNQPTFGGMQNQSDMSLSSRLDLDVNQGCTEGQRQCLQPQGIQECINGQWTILPPCPTNQMCQDGECLPFTGCAPGDLRGCISDTEQEICNDEGTDFIIQACPPDQTCLLGQCDDRACIPGQTRCSALDPSTVEECNADGEGWFISNVCADQTQCRGGTCMSQCDLAAKLQTYIGCEYWTVDLDNYPDPFTSPMPDAVPHSIVLSNPGEMEAQLQFITQSGVAIEIDQPTIPPGEARAFTMPRLDVDGSGISSNSIRVRSSMPVTAYQFNPLNNESVFSNDASLLIPASSLGTEHIIVSWSTGIDVANVFPLEAIVPQAGYFTVVAVQPGQTEVTLTLSADSSEGPNLPAMFAGEEHSFVLDQYQVLNVEADAFAPANFGELFTTVPHDLTGSIVRSSKPVAVFGGHEEAVIAYEDPQETGTFCCADHLEEQIFPVQSWRNEILCTKVKPRSQSGEKDLWRIFSGQDGNQITTIPPISDLNGIQLNYGQWVQIESAESFKVIGTGPLMVAQYIISQEQTDERKGDPSMILSVPVEQYRSDYTVLVPEGYTENWVTVIRPVGIEVIMDQMPISVSFMPFADQQWEMAYLALDPGVHTFQADQGFGLISYGWDQAVSYGYPAGLNFRSTSWMP